MIDFERFRKAPLVGEPFEHVIVPGFLRQEEMPRALEDFPPVSHGGSFPLSELLFGRGFSTLVDELLGAELREAVAGKFGIDLEGRPAIVTVRAHARSKDGRIHTDSTSKILTLLLYLNPGWTDAGGRLRLLRSSRSLEDYFAEIPPEAGTAVFFRCAENAWHGHTPYVGPRRALQLNWVQNESVARREQGRHRLSARLKTWLPSRARSLR